MQLKSEVIVKKPVLFLVLLCAATTVPAETSRYVSDQLTVPMRTGKSTQHKILRLVPSGTRVTVLEAAADGYSRVRIPQGTEGWILSRYLMDNPSARDRLASAEQQLQSLQERDAELTHQFETLTSGKAQVDELSEELRSENIELSEQLEAIRRTASDAISIAQQNEQLQQEVERLNSELTTVTEENESMKGNSNRNWFITGAAVALGSLIIGLIITRIPWKRRRRWDEL